MVPTGSRPALGPTQRPIQWIPRALSLGVKRPGREADHSLPLSAEVKNVWSYNSIPDIIFMACCLIRHRGHYIVKFRRVIGWIGKDVKRSGRGLF
jgi:hypothetical protein